MVARVLLPVALVMALFGSAVAEKAKLAVLGIEVAGSPDTSSTAHGRLLTDLLRGRIAVSPRYTEAPNSKKDLLDEKVAGNCETEAVACMSTIGGKMKAQLLIYGKIEKRPKDGKEGYQISMKSLDVEKKTTRDWGDWIPLSDFADGKLESRVAKGFDQLTKDDSAPVTGPGPNGPTGPTNGNAIVGKNPPKKSSGLGWKITAATATAVTVGLAAGGIVFRSKTKDLEGSCNPVRGMNGMPDPPLDSPEAYPGDNGKFTAQQCADGPSFSKKAWITGLSAVGVGGFALFAYYQGFIAKKESPTQTGSRVRKKKPIAVTPIVSPDGAGATVRIDF